MKRGNVLKLLLLTFSVPFICEYLIYYIVMFQCSWPTLDVSEENDDDVESRSVEPVKAMFIADTHLLNPKRSHWFDKLRREWQMYRSFQTAISLLQPELVFILGDIFDAGVCSDIHFNYYLDRLKSLFEVPKNIKLYFVAGNHDIGYHHNIYPYVYDRFVTELKTPSVQFLSFRGNHFVLINSMAMEGDGCYLCKSAKRSIKIIAKNLKCANGIEKCDYPNRIKQYSRPIVLQHFPMYRTSDVMCSEPDEAPEDIKRKEFMESQDCLSKEASDMIYRNLKPRLIVGGHTHHGCHIVHEKDIHEYSVPSFNWRNKNNPSFLLGQFLPSKFAVSKCYMPQESTVILLYCLSSAIILFWLITNYLPRNVHLYRYHRKIN